MLIRVFLGFVLSGVFFQCQANVNKYFESLQSEPKKLYDFLYAMPKGGELHYHLAGGAYPEEMIQLAGNAPFCIDTTSYTVTKSAAPCLDKPSQNLLKEPELYFNTIKAWSMADFEPSMGESGHDHFFSSFYKFYPIVFQYRAELLQQVMKKAASQNELYLEVMIMPDDAKSLEFGDKVQSTAPIKDIQKKLLRDAAFKEITVATARESERILKRARTLLGCKKNSSSNHCQLTVRFQYYLLREQPLNQFIAQAIHGFEAASQSNLIVGVNIVQAEDSIPAMQSYQRHMAVIQQLHKLYPNVHIALHAGELSSDMVKDKTARNHIFDAINIGQAERIGHGVSIEHEEHKDALLKQMSRKSIPVEINLTSNEKILNVKDNTHPLPLFLKHKVPVVLSTDDEGILRTDLTQEYVKATRRYQLNYKTIKLINRNTLTYSFLPGKSLWQDASKGILIPACKNLDSANCLKFINNNPKAKIQWQLEKQLTQFEKRYKSY